MDLRSFAKSHLPAPVNDALKLAKYNFDLWTFSKEIVSHRYGPHRLQMHIHDRVAKEWYDRGLGAAARDCLSRAPWARRRRAGVRPRRASMLDRDDAGKAGGPEGPRRRG